LNSATAGELTPGQKTFRNDEIKAGQAMKSSIGEHERVVLEAYLQDLIWGANNAN
jgi:hypothetical protein